MVRPLLARLGKAFEYLFKDYDFLSSFGTSLDYEHYWQSRIQREKPTGIEAVFKIQEAYKLNLIASLVEPKSRVLDIGCGDGSLLVHLKETKDIIPFGIEISSRACELARRSGIEVKQADISKGELSLPPDIDYILVTEVLEHLSNPIEVLMRLKGKFKLGLLIEIPNTGALSERLRLLLGRFPKQWILHPGEHLHFWTVTDFLFLCHRLGFRVENYYGLHDAYYDLGPLKLWKYYPKLFTRYVLYKLSCSEK